MPRLDPDARRRLRVYVREHHPDVGGDPAAFAEGYLRLEAELAGAAHGFAGNGPEVTFYREPRGLAVLVALIRHLIAARNQPPRVR
jgi:hypothetical protein